MSLESISMENATAPDPDRQNMFVGFTMAMAALTIVSIGLRFISIIMTKPKIAHVSRFWWDDWAALLAIPSVLAVYFLTIPATRLGYGKHAADVPYQNRVTISKITFTNYYLICVSMYLLKASALLFFSRICRTATPMRGFRSMLYLTHACNVIWYAGYMFVLPFLCQPVNKFWNMDLPGTCVSVYTVWLSMAIGGMIIDFMILLLPLPIIYSLHLGIKQKLGLLFVFALAYATILISVGRTISIVRWHRELNDDPFYSSLPIAYWWFADGAVTTACICFPSIINLTRHTWARLHPLPSKYTASLRSSASGSSQRSDSTAYEKHITVTKTYSLQEFDRESLMEEELGPVVGADMPGSIGRSSSSASVTMLKDEREGKGK